MNKDEVRILVAQVDLRIVADTREQLMDVLNGIQALDRTHVIEWREAYYDKKRFRPKGSKILEAIAVVEAKCREKAGKCDPEKERDE